MTRQEFLKLCSLVVAGTLLPTESKATSIRMPVLFFGHGSPMNIVLDNEFTQMLKETGKHLPKPKVILVISAHWEENETLLSTVSETETIYDFGGFPSELYEVSYPTKGSQALADRLNIKTTQRGLDHGAWSILRYLFPKADIPTMQLSINRNLSLQEHFEMGQQLALLREHGVLIIGSGSVTHNFKYFDHHNIAATPPESAEIFDHYVKQAIEKREFWKLIKPDNELLKESHPTLEHYIPLLYIAGLVDDKESSQFLYEGFQYGAFSMRAWQIG